ncbi:ATP dependent DNA ligase domain-containing protein [Pelagophyceae sp. CCMP2097]|nr:ATP dependent DNA ligase domain-containing protein [Pelagophyceae sp. CCMP2097]
MLRNARGTEAAWLVRTFQAHMSCGISLEASIVPALAKAALLERTAAPDAAALQSVSAAARAAYSRRADIGALVEALFAAQPTLKGFLDALETACLARPGTPPAPMLAAPATSVDDALAKARAFVPPQGGPRDDAAAEAEAAPEASLVLAEHKYDGQRAQLHRSAGGVFLFSRKSDDMTDKYPEVARALALLRCSAFIFDAEVVPVDANGRLLPFQDLSTRKRADVQVDAVTQKVHVFLFDALFVNGKDVTSKPLWMRRQLLRQALQIGEDGLVGESGLVHLATSVQVDFSQPVAAQSIETALLNAVQKGCEGLVLKRLDAPYEYSLGSKRSLAWIKLKKDYVGGLGDSLDLVPVGGWRGSGRKSKWISPILMATHDPQTGDFGSCCRVMSGFTDAFYIEFTKQMLGREMAAQGSGAEADAADADDGADDVVEDVIDVDADDDVDANIDFAAASIARGLRSTPHPGVATGEKCAFWFTPQVVWEVRCSDVTLSPVHRSAAGMVAERGLGLRFPRFIRVRLDKSINDATTPRQLADAFLAQRQGKKTADEEDGFL